ncbi:mycofactocin-coupled SDR family oxidoreductase [Mycobacterium sp.]|uniref:mycofactocin-coupled SDR family oxidoreductase n=1 Tax=Mycobacterium sp. TaxID=1785 RepID=UPI003D6BDBE7
MRMLGKVAIVTGAARGMSRAHCVRLAQEGADIAAVDLPQTSDDLAETAELVRSHGRRCRTGFADVRDGDQLTAAIDADVGELGGLDVVVANAGIYADLALSWQLTDEAWQRTLDVNLTGVWHTVKACIPHLRSGGSIVIVSSTSGLRGGAAIAHYAASKHALVGLTRSLANELGSKGIRVNSVHPGSVATPMILNDTVFAKLRPDLASPSQDDAAEILASRNLLPVPWVEPEDVSNAVLFLACDESRYITGTKLVVDAGLTQKT